MGWGSSAPARARRRACSRRRGRPPRCPGRGRARHRLGRRRRDPLAEGQVDTHTDRGRESRIAARANVLTPEPPSSASARPLRNRRWADRSVSSSATNRPSRRPSRTPAKAAPRTYPSTSQGRASAPAPTSQPSPSQACPARVQPRTPSSSISLGPARGIGRVASGVPAACSARTARDARKSHDRTTLRSSQHPLP